jgi:hypothetical protein
MKFAPPEAVEKVPMTTTQQATRSAAVLDAVRLIVDDDAHRLQARRPMSVLRVIAIQKAANEADGLKTDPEDNWALLLSAVNRGDL